MLSKVNVKYWVSGFVLVTMSVCVSLAQQPKAQTKAVKDTKVEKKDQPDDKTREVDTTGPAVYQKGNRSPFEDPVRRPKLAPPAVRLFPPVDERLRDYMARRAQAKANGSKLPSALSAFIVDEVEINGIFKTNDGYGAVLRAKPTNQTYFVHVGDKLYNGSIKRLEAKQVVFTSIIWMNNSKDDVREVTKVIQAPAGGQEVPAEVKQQ